MIDNELLFKLEESGKVHSIELLRSDIRNYKKLKFELDRVESEYVKGMLPFREKIEWANAELEKIKSPGYGDGLGGHVETLDQKLSRLEEEKADAAQKIASYMSANNYIYYNRKWVLMSRISAVEKALSEMNEKDRGFINDLYIEPIGFKNVMKKYGIDNEGNIYRKSNNILKKVL